jgi:hypothetical protein
METGDDDWNGMGCRWASRRASAAKAWRRTQDDAAGRMDIRDEANSPPHASVCRSRSDGGCVKLAAAAWEQKKLVDDLVGGRIFLSIMLQPAGGCNRQATTKQPGEGKMKKY